MNKENIENWKVIIVGMISATGRRWKSLNVEQESVIV